MGGQKVSIYVIVMQVHMLFHDCGAYKWKLNVSFFSYLAKRVKTTMDMKTCLQFSPFMKCSLKVSQRFLFFFATSWCVKNSSTEKFNFEIIFLNIH